MTWWWAAGVKIFGVGTLEWNCWCRILVEQLLILVVFLFDRIVGEIRSIYTELIPEIARF